MENKSSVVTLVVRSVFLMSICKISDCASVLKSLCVEYTEHKILSCFYNVIKLCFPNLSES